MFAGVPREKIQNAAIGVLAVEPAHCFLGVGISQLSDTLAQKGEGPLEVGDDLLLVGRG